MTPDARRRLAGALMTEQFNRPTPQDTEVVERAGLLPVGTYANGMTGPALPGFITQPFESFKRLVDQGYESGNPQSAEDAFNVAGAAMVGGLAAPRPRSSIGMSGRPEGAALNAAGERSAGSVGPSGRLLEGSGGPIQQQSRQMGGDQRGRTAVQSQPQQEQGSRANWLNDPSLADIAARYGLQTEGALAEHIAKAIADPGGYEYGIRTTPYKVDPGKTMPDSVQWYQDANPVPWKELSRDERSQVRGMMEGPLSLEEIKSRSWDPNYLDHGDPLGGASSIGIMHPERQVTPGNINAGRGYQSYGADGDFVHLVRSSYGKNGLDRGERILSDAEVVAVAPYGPTLFANGGRPGAAVGAVSTADIVRALMEDDANKYRGAI